MSTGKQQDLRKYAIIALWLAVAWLVSGSALAADHSCSDCHASATPSAADLIKPLSGLCADCHAARIAAGEHLVDVPVSVATVLPTSDGKLTCVTCHDPHQPRAALRMQDPALCRQCHPR